MSKKGVKPAVAAHIPSRPSGPKVPFAKDTTTAMDESMGGASGNQPPPPPPLQDYEDGSSNDSSVFAQPEWDQATLDLVKRAKIKAAPRGSWRSTPCTSTSESRGTDKAGTKRTVEEWSPETNTAPSKKTKVQDDGLKHLYFHYKERKDGAKIGKTEIELVSAHFRHQIDEVDGKFLIKIGAIKYFRGYGSIECHDQLTFDWADGVVKVMAGGAFISYDESEVKQPTFKVGMWVADRETPNATLLLSAIRKQNGIDTSKWRMISSNPVKGKKGGQFVLMEVDQISFQSIQPPKKFYYYTNELSFTFKPVKPK